MSVFVTVGTTEFDQLVRLASTDDFMQVGTALLRRSGDALLLLLIACNIHRTDAQGQGLHEPDDPG